MWVQALYIDEFDGGGDLILHQLDAALCVVRVPSQIAEAGLAHFIPTLLYGPDDSGSIDSGSIDSGSIDSGGRVRGGSLVVAQQTETGTWETLDLCRLSLDDEGELSQLQILPQRESVIDEGRLRETLEAIDGPVYRVVFTDRLRPGDRLASWRSADWIVPLLRRQESASPSENETQAATRGAGTALRRRARARWLRIRRDLERPHADKVVNEVTNKVTDGSIGLQLTSEFPASREAYLQAKQQTDLRREQIGKLRAQLQRQQHLMTPLERAIEVLPTWNRIRVLEARLDAASGVAASGVAVAEDDVRRIVLIKGQLPELRQQVGQLREHRTAAADLQQQSQSAQRRHRQLQSLLDAWPMCRDRQHHVRALREQLADRERRGKNGVGYEQVALESNVVDTRPASDDQIENLRRQIRQRRTETRALLRRQVISRKALIGIGVLFATGVAAVLAGLLLNLDGANMATGSMGLTCMLAAALLKSSFERTPTYQLREQRLKVATLLSELQAIQTFADATESMSERAPSTAKPDRGDRHDHAGESAALTCQLDDHLAHIDQWCRGASDALRGDAAEAADSESQTPEQCRARLQAEMRRLSAAIAGPKDGQHVDTELARVEQLVTDLKRERRRILERYSVSKSSTLERRLKGQIKRRAWKAERERQQQQLESFLSASLADREAIEHWLAAGRDLESEREAQRPSINETQHQLAEAQEALVQDQATIERWAARPPGIPRISENEKATFDDALALDLAGAVIASLGDNDTTASVSPVVHHSTRPPKLLRLATRYLQQIGDDRSLEVGWDDPAMGPYVLRKDPGQNKETTTSYDDAPTELQQTLVLSLQLALVQCLTQRIGHLPLVLTDRSFATANATAARIARLLSELAEAGQQIMVVTVDTRVSEQFQRLRIPTLVVTRQAHPGPEAAVQGADREASIKNGP